MFKRMWMGLWIAVCGLAVPTLQAAEEAPQPYVVLVGIDQFKDPQIKARQHAEADAQAMYDLFTSKDYLGVSKQRIKLLLGKADSMRSSEPATRANIIKALTWIEKSSRRDDLVVFAYFVN